MSKEISEEKIFLEDDSDFEEEKTPEERIKELELELSNLKQENESLKKLLNIEQKVHEPKIGRPKSQLFIGEKKHKKQNDERTKDFYNQILSFCSQENLEMETILVYLLRKFYWNSNETTTYDYEKGKFYDDILKGKNPFQANKLPLDESVYLFDTLETGKEPYNNILRKLRPYLQLQPYKKVIKRREEEFPEFITGPNGGIWAPIRSATTKITEGILKYLVDKEELEKIEISEGTIEFEAGFDASGKNDLVEEWYSSGYQI